MILTLLSLVTAVQIVATAAVAPAIPPAEAVELVVYSDFQCPFCAMFSQAFRELQTHGVDGVKTTFRFKNFPLPMHPQAQLAHQAALAAGEQGKFWEMHDQLYMNHSWAQTGKNPTGLFRDFARAAGLDVSRYDACLESGRYAARIEFSRQEGEQKLVNGTPTFYINGKMYMGRNNSDAFKAAIDSAAAAARRK